MEKSKLSSVGNYQLTGKRLGTGSFAKVYEAKHRQLNNVIVAVKVVNFRDMNDDYMKKWYKREAMLLSQLNHPGIVALFEVMETQNLFFMVLECAGVNLCDYVISQSRGRLDESIARSFAKQLTAAVGYIHDKQIIHRDIKLENVLVDVEQKRVKLTDFGLSRAWDRISLLTTNCGSPEYASPELHAGRSYGTKVDIWALGVVFFGMVVGRLPFEVNTKKPVSTQVQKKLFLDETKLGVKTMKHQTFMGSASYLFKNLLSKMLQPLPQQRFSIEQVREHAWIKSLRIDDHFTPLDVDAEMRRKIIEKISADHKIPIMDIVKKLDEKPFGAIGGMFNIEKHSYQSIANNQPSIKLSASFMKIQPLVEMEKVDRMRPLTTTTTRGRYHHHHHHDSAADEGKMKLKSAKDLITTKKVQQRRPTTTRTNYNFKIRTGAVADDISKFIR